LLDQVVNIRALKPKGPVERGVKSREEIAAYVDRRAREEFEEGEIIGEGKILKLFGLIPETMDYRDFALKLLTEQVGGYYDPDQKTLFIAGWLPGEQQRPVMVHELTHALQDQNFNLGEILKDDRQSDNSDRILAHHAVIEGDAMLVMLNYLLAPMGRDFSQLANLASLTRTQLASSDSQYEIFGKAPMYLKETLLFPYGYGSAFLQKLWTQHRSWSAIDKLYSDLPTSSEQIMHPEKYLVERDNPKPIEVEDQAALLGPGWKLAYKNVLGEFSTALLLRLYLPEEQAMRAASGWGGDQAMLLEEGDGERAAVFAFSVWDTQEEADEFFQAMKVWLVHRYSDTGGASKDSGDELSLRLKGERHTLARHGNSVRLILGLPEELFERIRPELDRWRESDGSRLDAR